jgi:hypothetical protein
VYQWFLRCPSAKGLFIFLHDGLLLNKASTQNTQVSETKEFRRTYFIRRESKNHFKNVQDSVMCYRGTVVAPRWKDVDTGLYLFGFKPTKYYLIVSIDNYTELCTIEVDLSHLPFSPRLKSSGGIYYQLKYELVLLFGLTEFKAAVAWKENVGPHLVLFYSFYLLCCQGVERQTPAKVLYDPDPSTDDPKIPANPTKPLPDLPKPLPLLAGAGLLG